MNISVMDNHQHMCVRAPKKSPNKENGEIKILISHLDPSVEIILHYKIPFDG